MMVATWTKNIPGLGNLTLMKRRRYVATRTIYSRDMGFTVVVLYDLDEGKVWDTMVMGGPRHRNDAISAVNYFNRVLDANGGKW